MASSGPSATCIVQPPPKLHPRRRCRRSPPSPRNREMGRQAGWLSPQHSSISERTFGVAGLTRYALAPRARARSRSRSTELPVNANTRTSESWVWDRSHSKTSKPLRKGIFKSRNIACGMGKALRSANGPWPERYLIASSPFTATCCGTVTFAFLTVVSDSKCSPPYICDYLC